MNAFFFTSNPNYASGVFNLIQDPLDVRHGKIENSPHGLIETLHAATSLTPGLSDCFYINSLNPTVQRARER